MLWPTQTGIWRGGDLTLRSGAKLQDAILSWKTHGTLSAAKDNVIIYPTSYGARHPDLEWLIGPEGILDPTRYFIIILDQFGNGLSSSPSNTPDYPALVTVRDNVEAQRMALAETFGIDQVACVYGWSMGALQAYHWAALFPDAVERIVVNCGVSRTAVHNQVFLRSLMATLEAAPQHIGNGRFSSEPRAAKRAFALWYDALIHLWRANGVGLPRQMIPAEFEPALEGGYIVAGSPATVRDRLKRDNDVAGINYCLCRLAFGDLSFEESKRSIELFASEVMPAL